MFGLSASLPPLVGGGGGLLCESVGRADLLSDHFDGKQSGEFVYLPLTCHPSPRLPIIAFRSRVVRHLLLDLDPYEEEPALTHCVYFLFFFKRTAVVLVPCLRVIFRRLVRPGSFPACWRQAKVTPIPKGSPSSSVANYRHISITSVLSKVFGRLVSVRFGQFMECSGVLLTIQFAYQEGLGIRDAFLCMSHALQSALKSRQEARIVQIDFCTAFDRVNHQAISSSSAVWELDVLCCLF